MIKFASGYKHYITTDNNGMILIDSAFPLDEIDELIELLTAHKEQYKKENSEE